MERVGQLRDQVIQQAQLREHELQNALQTIKESGEQEVIAIRHQLAESRQSADAEIRELIKSHKAAVAELTTQIEREKEAHNNDVSLSGMARILINFSWTNALKIVILR